MKILAKAVAKLIINGNTIRSLAMTLVRYMKLAVLEDMAVFLFLRLSEYKDLLSWYFFKKVTWNLLSRLSMLIFVEKDMALVTVLLIYVFECSRIHYCVFIYFFGIHLVIISVEQTK